MSEATPAPVKERGHRKIRQGTVVKAKAQQTIVVEVRRTVQHKKYKKYLVRKDRYAVHDLVGCEVGDRVRISETRPLSKTKRWRVLEKIAKDA